ncbi:MAG: hypothetical protein HRU01_18240 [Myxococcales bacterium]|nr:hypothetical protein [Myxococcales bacterium]
MYSMDVLGTTCSSDVVIVFTETNADRCQELGVHLELPVHGTGTDIPVTGVLSDRRRIAPGRRTRLIAIGLTDGVRRKIVD